MASKTDTPHPRRITIEFDEDMLTEDERKSIRKSVSAIRKIAKASGGADVRSRKTKILGPYKSNSTSGKNFDKLKEDLNKIHEELSKRKRRYLRREDWNDPNQPATAEVNKSSKRLPVPVSADHIELFGNVAEHFPTKRDALERAVELLAAVEEAPSALDKKSTDKLTPRVSPEHLDLFKQAAVKFPTKRIALEYAVELLSAELEHDNS